ncbi:MAG: hypothetical protein IJZ74_08690 [Clostridia bacterium]|nr:hypothetical protein [Clostridia bacterium]
MKHITAFLILLSLLFTLSAHAEPLTFADDLAGVYTYPEGSSEDDARYIYRYCYPQIADNSDIALLINTTYQYTADDALGFEVPMQASDVQEDDPQKIVDVSYKITWQDEDYLSVAIYKQVTSGNELSTVISGHVFALHGSNAGNIVSLPILLGILKADETDEWYKERQTAKADACVRGLVWDRLQEMQSDGTIALYEDLTYEEFEACFYPEEDFYLDENGNPLFFLLPGSVAPEDAGEFLITITMEELLDEI